MPTSNAACAGMRATNALIKTGMTNAWADKKPNWEMEDYTLTDANKPTLRLGFRNRAKLRASGGFHMQLRLRMYNLYSGQGAAPVWNWSDIPTFRVIERIWQ